LEITFSELILLANLMAGLKIADSGEAVPLKVLRSDSRSWRFQPEKALPNYRPCLLSLTASDISGNQLEYQLNFLPLKRD
jgi:hypothetical protein